MAICASPRARVWHIGGPIKKCLLNEFFPLFHLLYIILEKSLKSLMQKQSWVTDGLFSGDYSDVS